MNPEISVIIVQYGNSADTTACIESIENCGLDRYNVTVVDNHSPDDSLEKVRVSLGGRHRILALDRNGGFAAGLNAGIAFAREHDRPDFFLLLNNDILVTQGSVAELLESFGRFPRAGVAAPLLYTPSGDIYFAGGSLDLFRGVSVHNRSSRSLIEHSCGFLIGCFLLVKNEVLERTGLLDERFFMFYEDADFCFRIRQAGYDLIFNPKATAVHKGGASMGGRLSPFAIEWWTRSRRRFTKKHSTGYPPPIRALATAYFYATRIVYLIRYLVCGKPALAVALLKALLKPSPLPDVP